MAEIFPIVIIGDGISAEAMAAAFAKAGRKVHLIGDFTSNTIGGIQLAPNAWQALEVLDLAVTAKTKALPLAMVRLLTLETGEVLTTLPLNEIEKRTPYTSMPRHDLINILKDHNDKSGLVTRHNAKVKTLKADKHGMTLSLNDNKKISAKWVIGCDGARGIARQYVEAGGGRKPLLSRYAFRALGENAENVLGGYATNVWLGKGGHVVHYPLSDGALNIVAVASNKESALALIKKQPLLTPLEKLIKKATAIPLYDYPLLDAWQRDKVILAGDAAHPMPPHLAQGAGQTLIDASSLYHMLKNHKGDEGDDLQPLFTAWSAERLRTIRNIVKDANRIGSLFALDGLGGRLRDIGLLGLGDALLAKSLDGLWTMGGIKKAPEPKNECFN